MESFIRADQYNFIKDLITTLLSTHTSTNDQAVTQALKSITREKIVDLFSNLSNDQKEIIEQVQDVKDETDAIFFLSRLKQYTFTFPPLNEQTLKQLFPKVKKLKVPSLENIEWSTLSYLGWNDSGSNQKYIATYKNGDLLGIQGNFKPSKQSGICAICKEHEEVGMFTTSIKQKTSENPISRGNYICKDSHRCNENLKSLQPLKNFIELMTE
ncbi:FBP C-terminal treble-clef zinc-finger [Halobacillus alkaliphilus]|uniref:FBP C-terminal treble-clef zinc-finger n=1 Tax=Halobacillus alkaliphilus TaxID=396056 RepID=A0A1I2JKB0_9BACI|nr:FusB/FusC family EF-G-binding protein [Halobacillus alkaliphilus]SFF55325.1 FBP C-terminal treble-clef zinc-finger [Halobacillus alkaliphilus]